MSFYNLIVHLFEIKMLFIRCNIYYISYIHYSIGKYTITLTNVPDQYSMCQNYKYDLPISGFVKLNFIKLRNIKTWYYFLRYVID